MRRNNQAAAEDEAQIDLTPMLDVVFIMLIFFIVTASFIKEAGVEVNRPEASTSNPVENVNILVAVNANNEIWMDNRRIDVRAVRANIERLHAENPKGAVVIQADNKSNTETVAAVLDAAREAGVYDVSLATEDK
ncbi:ExbD/TolR family protein [Parahaliea mediterranea]|uniref:Biopolymer transporter ExbD n=1 Tax=Parahaliea mediterranea TaxID=651086 RepID=A0A939IK75_9GAMM|nr:biopolymer transporter ExbD [Parahaliea mediterranea]MBN7797041.1 biopolymer transporter ExbD [Parahaliea mediterranea]